MNANALHRGGAQPACLDRTPGDERERAEPPAAMDARATIACRASHVDAVSHDASHVARRFRHSQARAGAQLGCEFCRTIR
ncbi:hypothetical protein WS71_10960 [Burkholderia mayonis]|uniref:Uncharacterized protein n=1 Tax=Burkholderia mayonis TaxID=1385591 RepID=A0A1B4FVN9_9BURK|nr:hypothetical protein WS71_10960 [Burkholderia mayonis]KVE50280.1 hypothetical protein WS71_14475 [Burkholderia mayonis]